MKRSNRRGTERTVRTAGGLRVTISLPSGEWWAAVAAHQNRMPVVEAGAEQRAVA